MKLLYISCLLLWSIVADSQKIVKGLVVDEATMLPVNKATVFINRTSTGTTTNERGEFTLAIPFGRHALIGMAPGFETDGQFISSNEISDSIIIYLKTKPQPLQKNLEGYEKDGWEKWSELFLTNFLGSFIDEQCKIKNRKALKFRISSQTGELMAISDEPLIIENKALGYTVLYKLESFHYNFKTFIVSYTATLSFNPWMETQRNSGIGK